MSSKDDSPVPDAPQSGIAVSGKPVEQSGIETAEQGRVATDKYETEESIQWLEN